MVDELAAIGIVDVQGEPLTAFAFDCSDEIGGTGGVA